VLRRIIRRAIRHGYQLGQKRPFFFKLVDDLDRQMGDAYPELRREKARVAQVLKTEEERFGETIDNGMSILDGAIARCVARATPCSTARPRSRSTTPTASRST
jgi:alanyl-tRNA synthetase